MKKTIAILLALVMVFGSAACAKTEPKAEPAPAEPAAPAAAEAPAEPKATEAPAAPEKTLAGKYTGKAAGYHGDVQVEIELDAEGKLIGVTVGDNTETEGVGTTAIENIPGKIVESRSLAVDAVTGATKTSRAIVAAVADALTSAGLDPAAYGYVPAEPEAVELSAFDASALPEKKVSPPTGMKSMIIARLTKPTIVAPRYTVLLAACGMIVSLPMSFKKS